MNIHISRTLLATAVAAVALTGCSTTSKNTAAEPKPVPIAAAPAPRPAPPPAVVIAPAPAPVTVYVIEDVNFEFDKSTLKPSATATLDQVVADLRKQPKVHYDIVGFTDSIGSEAYNLGLSQRRAMAVHDYLVSHGVPATQLSSNGRGEMAPMASNTTQTGRAQNRRVEIRHRV